MEGLEESQHFFSEYEDIEEDSQLEVNGEAVIPISQAMMMSTVISRFYIMEAHQLIYMYVECRRYDYPLEGWRW